MLDFLTKVLNAQIVLTLLGLFIPSALLGSAAPSIFAALGVAVAALAGAEAWAAKGAAE